MSHPATILSYKPDQPIGHPFTELASVDSTNNYATGQAHAGLASHGAVWFAHEQYAGKGQRGKTWISRPGDNIIMSAVLEPARAVAAGLSMTRQFPLNACIALGCYDFFSQYALPDQTSIKWPNDLYWRDRKAGGILIENICRGNDWLFAIAGIGININQVEFAGAIKNPVSLRQITGETFDAAGLARELAAALEKRYAQLRTGAVETQLADYNDRLFRRQMPVTLKRGEVLFHSILKGVNESGALVVTLDDGGEKLFQHGEVEWVL